MPNSIVLDRDPTFTSNFLKEFFTLQRVQLAFNTAYYTPKPMVKQKKLTSGWKIT